MSDKKRRNVDVNQFKLNPLNNDNMYKDVDDGIAVNLNDQAFCTQINFGSNDKQIIVDTISSLENDPYCMRASSAFAD